MEDRPDTVRSNTGVILRVFDPAQPPPASGSDPEVTIQKHARVTINGAAARALGLPEAIEFLYSEEEQIMGLRRAEPGTSRSYRLRKGGRGTSYQTSGEAFIKGYGIPHERATRYKAEVDGDMLLVDLKQGGVDVSIKRRQNSHEGS